MDNNEEFGYFSKTVADRLGVSPDTLRSWAIKLEDKEIEFERNEKKQRIYYEKDIRAFENMKELLDLQQPMNKVVPLIADKIKKGEFKKPETENHTEITPSVIRENTALATPDQRLEQQYNQLMEAFKIMTSEYAATREKLDSIEVNSRETNSKMDEVLDRLKKEQEEKLLFKEKLDIAVEFIQKQEQLASAKQKKSLFQRLFGN
ncbi:MerR family transcriptional regulator (plasmid) [Neobacillus niacini]|jgi:DNA-binding transcriptional MerR regulator|uniref:MerR family transcriptional regulator n=1 Tax=Neobacillus niacini TaxID=86668 RepID=UPI003B016EFF